MKYYFHMSFVHNNELIFYLFIIVMILIMLFASYAVYKELKK